MLAGRHSPLESGSPRLWNLAAMMAAALAASAACLDAGPMHLAAANDKAADAKKSVSGKLSYNDNTSEGKKSIGGSGEMLSFTLPGDGAKVAGIRIHGSRYGLPQPPKEDFLIYFLDADASETVATKTAPYARFERGEQQWVTIRFPKPIEVPKEFWVCLDFRAERTKGVYVSVDESTDGSRSRVGLPGIESREAGLHGDWMIEVLLAK
jgi:RNA polymerase sigma-70 factor (ECF subfamily)